MTREKFANQCCSSLILTSVALLFLAGGPACGQSQSIAKEYIRLGGKVIAIESYGQSQSSTVKIDVWPGTANLAPNQAVRLNSIVVGNTNTNVNWTISPNVGSILATGVYTAPPNPQPGQTIMVTATSAADPTKSATAVIQFYSPAINGAFPLMGSFLNFYRNLGQSQWGLEFDRMREIDMNTVVIVSVGGLRPVTGNAAAYTLSGVGLLYPSELIPIAERPATDRLEMMLSLADQRGMKVYLGSLQTHQDWSTGLEFSALRTWNRQVMQEVVTRYGHHPSLEGWYFTQELWMNWVRYYGASTYYGTLLLKDFVDDMRAVDATKPVSTAVVFKKTLGSIGMTPLDLQGTTQTFLQATGLQILMPQDGGGAEAGAPPISELPGYFQALSNAVNAAGTGTALWSTVETFTQVPGLSNDRYPPASAARIQQQVNYVRPHVTGMVNWIFGNDMSDQATYYPVEASSLDREYRWRFRPSVTPQLDAHVLSSYSYSIAPAASYSDSVSKLSNRQGGGFNGYSLSDWVGHPVESTNGVVRVTADLGAVKSIRNVKALSLSLVNGGIYHPSSMTVEISQDGVSYTQIGSATTVWQNTLDFSVGWTAVAMAQNARYIRCSFAHISWMFLSEIEVQGTPYTAPPPPGSIGISVDPVTVSLVGGQTQQFTASVSGGSNTAVTWSRSPVQGSISAQGLYTAPATVTTAQSVAIVATSVADTTKSASSVVTLNPNAALSGIAGDVNPRDGTGAIQIFHFEATALGGSVNSVWFLINTDLNATSACFVQFDAATNTVSISADNSQSNLYTWADWGGVGSGAPIGNSQCEVDLLNSASVITATKVTVDLSLRFKPAFAGTRHMYIAANDTAGNADRWVYKGYWVIP